MAKLIEEYIMVKISTIVKDNEVAAGSHIDEDLLNTIESVAQELVGGAALVEVNIVGEE
jgi:hypothetical protein